MEESNVQIRPPILPSLCWRNRNGKGRPTCVLDQEVENRPTSTWPLCHAMCEEEPVADTASAQMLQPINGDFLGLCYGRCSNNSGHHSCLAATSTFSFSVIVTYVIYSCKISTLCQ
uniref:Uncharacterized protein n=1 Tax=Triticum urartu TaxID=4572 RepID=A0A8R7R9S1_TRIUA